MWFIPTQFFEFAAWLHGRWPRCADCRGLRRQPVQPPECHCHLWAGTKKLRLISPLADIISVFQVTDGEPIMIVFEFMANGSLYSFLSEVGKLYRKVTYSFPRHLPFIMGIVSAKRQVASYSSDDHLTFSGSRHAHQAQVCYRRCQGHGVPQRRQLRPPRESLRW